MATLLTGRMPQYSPAVIRHVPMAQAGEWVRRGWDDLKHCGGASIAHGVLIAALGAVLLILGSSHPFFVAAAISGYLLIGPVMTTGVCELSRRRATGEPISFDASLQALRRNPRALLEFGAILAALAIVWFVASELMLRAISGLPWPNLGEVLWGASPTKVSAAEIVGYLVTGGVLAAIVFMMSVVAVPLMIDRGAGAGEAISTSIRATFANLPAMFIWSVLIVALTALGFFTLLLGMIVVAPLLGHATWHVYRDVVGDTT